MAKKVKLMLIILIFVLSVCTLMACGHEETPQKMVFEQVLENSNNQQNQTIDSTLKAEYICYNAGGTPGKITERLDLTRTTAEDVYYLYGELRTEELTNILKTIINEGLKLMSMSGSSKIQPLLDYINGETYIVGRSGLKDDVLNGQVVLCEEDTSPVFEFAEDGSDILNLKKAWGAIKYSDFVKFKDSFDIESIKNADFLEMLYSSFSLPIDWKAAVDSAAAEFITVGGKKLARYDLTYPVADMQAYIKATIEKYMTELWGDDEKTYNTIKSYYDKYIDYAFEVFTITDLRTVASVDEQNRLASMDTDFGVKMIITDEEILDILADEGVSTKDLRTVKSYLIILHTMFGCSSQEKGKFEMELRLSLSDKYTYGDVKIDTDDNLYLPFDEYGVGRATAEYVEGEDGEYKWDFHFPEKVAEWLKQHEKKDKD